MPKECKTFLSEVPNLIAEKQEGDKRKKEEASIKKDQCKTAALK